MGRPAVRATVLTAAAGVVLALTPVSSGAADAVAAVAPLAVPGASCPDGSIPDVRLQEGFEAPFDAHDGWSQVVGDASEGAAFARATLLFGSAAHIAGQIDVLPGERTYVSFVTRGALQPSDYVTLLWEGDARPFPQPGSTWQRVRIDVTWYVDELGPQEAALYYYNGREGTTTTWDVDDFSVYTCGAPYLSGGQGDWTGDAIADVLFVRQDGDLWITGARGAPVRIGGGWGSTTWLGSPGDLTADGRPDLLARRSDGTLWLYPGQGAAKFLRPTRVGNGWSTMTAMAVSRDLVGDQRPDLLARTPDGYLHHYQFTGTRLDRVQRLGRGWNSFTHLAGCPGRIDRPPGQLYGVHTDGTLYLFAKQPAPLAPTLTGRAVGSGFGSATEFTCTGPTVYYSESTDLLTRYGGQWWLYISSTGGFVPRSPFDDLGDVRLLL